MSSVPPSSALPPAPGAGWYADPWRPGGFRWWDGSTWTGHAVVPGPGPGGTAPGRGTGARKPGLPSWLSVPVLGGGALVVPLMALLAVTEPSSAALAFVPLVFVVPVLVWVDRLEPEPRAARLHAFLWGATISILVASAVNATVAATVGESAAAVASAPFVEEIMKGLAVVLAVRRREVDGVVDGIVYAGWTAAGFAVVENIEYFLAASDDGVLAETFVLRAVLTPFAHPLFTVFTGIAIGTAVARGRPLRAAWWGLVAAIALHAAWNGSLVAVGDREDATLLAVAAAAFVGIFVLAATILVLVRRRERGDYLAAMPHLVATYGLTADEVATFATWRELLAARRRLPAVDRRRFDDLHAALARLAALRARPAPVDPAEEDRLRAQLDTARSAIR